MLEQCIRRFRLGMSAGSDVGGAQRTEASDDEGNQEHRSLPCSLVDMEEGSAHEENGEDHTRDE